VGQLFPQVTKVLTEDAESSVQASLMDRRILLVEDDPDTQELLKTLLRRNGAEVIAVSSSAAALEEIARRKPDVIISDIGMTGENGYALIRKVRALAPEAGGHIPAIALTAYAGAADRRRALLAGFQTHLAKPVDPADLIAVILSLTFQRWLL
jgi:CheY-like chemotaxis protein